MPTVSISGSVTDPNTGEQVFLSNGEIIINADLSDLDYSKTIEIFTTLRTPPGSNETTFSDIFYTTGNPSFSFNIPVRGTGNWELILLISQCPTEPEVITPAYPSTYSIIVINYTALQFLSWSGYRCNSAGTEDPAGTYVKVLASVTSYGTATITAKAKVKGTSTYVKTTTIPNNTETILSGFDSSSTYIFEAVATDDYGGTATRSFEIGTQPVPIDFLAGGKGVAIGKVAETEELLDSAWPIKAPSITLNTPISVAAGGTEKSSWAVNRLIYPSASTAFTQLAFPDTTGSFLRQDTSGTPYWTPPTDVRKMMRSILRLGLTSNQTISSTAAVKVTLSNSTEIDSNNVLSVSSNGIKVSTTGYYLISAQLMYKAVSSTGHQATLAINDGSNYILKAVAAMDSASGSITDIVSLPPALVYLSTGTVLSAYYAGRVNDVIYGATSNTGTKYGTFLQVEYVA